MSDKTCNSRQDIKDIVGQLNSGHGDAASLKLIECASQRWSADPNVKDATNALNETDKNHGERLHSLLNLADAREHVSSKLINEVKQAQASTADKHLCKLDIDEQGAPKIKKTADCHVTEYNFKYEHGDFVRVKDKP